MTHYAQALAEIVAAIRPLDDAAQAQARQRQDSLLKPPAV